MHLCNSTEICDETRNNDLKICYLGARFFSLFVVYIREIRGWTGYIQWYTFSRTTSYFLRKWQKKPFSSNLGHLAQKWSTQSFKKEIKTRKKSFNSFFFKLKNVDTFKSYKDFKLNVETA